jgi:hypothetical protein
MNITQELLKHLFDYEKETGQLIWKKRGFATWDNKMAGKAAGSFRGEKCPQIGISGTLYSAHKLVWLRHYGYWADYIDHINGNNYDNRIENLREATHTQNLGNRNAPERGVYWRNGTYRARIGFKGYRIHLGYFATKEEAHEAYRKASIELHGEFSSYSRS